MKKEVTFWGFVFFSQRVFRKETQVSTKLKKAPVRHTFVVWEYFTKYLI